MQSRRRGYRSQCFDKVGYHRKKDAKAGMRRLQSLPREERYVDPEHLGARLCVYRCPHCGLWHIGHAVDPDCLPHRQ